jgi:hypothetical protein
MEDPDISPGAPEPAEGQLGLGVDLHPEGAKLGVEELEIRVSPPRRRKAGEPEGR